MESCENTVAYNNVSGNSGCGIFIVDTSDSNTIEYNRVNDNSGDGICIGSLLERSENDNIVRYNNVGDNCGNGIKIGESGYNDRIEYNIVFGNGVYDLYDLGTGNVWKRTSMTSHIPKGLGDHRNPPFSL